MHPPADATTPKGPAQHPDLHSELAQDPGSKLARASVRAEPEKSSKQTSLQGLQIGHYIVYLFVGVFVEKRYVRRIRIMLLHFDAGPACEAVILTGRVAPRNVEMVKLRGYPGHAFAGRSRNRNCKRFARARRPVAGDRTVLRKHHLQL